METEIWQPNLSPKQRQFVADTHRCILACGPRRTGKTIACLNKLVWWLWQYGGPAAIVGRSITDVFNCGTWTDLIDYVLPEWVEGDFGLEIVTPPKMEGATKRYYFEITNSKGGISRCYLESIDNENEVARKFKNKRYSFVYMIELTNFKQRYTFDTLYETLRVIGRKPEEHCLIADTNPDFELGTDSWIYKLWYWFKNLNLDNLTKEEKAELALNDLNEDEYHNRIISLKKLQKELSLYEFFLEDNPFISESEKQEIKARWSSCGNPAIYDAYVNGIWSRAATEGYFSDVFKVDIHVFGEELTASNPNPAMLLPEDDCYHLYSGWDIGSTNTAISIMEKIYQEDLNGDIVPAFKLLDEIVIIKQPHSIRDLVDIFYEKMIFWEKLCKGKVSWTHWSDSSSFDKFNNVSESYEAMEVYRASDGRIILQAAFKGPGIIKKRSDLLKKLLFQNRIYINRPKCPNTINMFLNIGRDKNGDSIDKFSIHKHIFDAISYCISMECYSEMHLSIGSPKTDSVPESRIITAPI